MLRSPDQPVLVVLNKCDLPSRIEFEPFRDAAAAVVEVSATTGDGLTMLRDRIVEILTGRHDWRDPPAISNIRHLEQVEQALGALTRAEAALRDGATEELVLAELAVTRDALEEITGKKTSEDLLRHIFGRFCIGK
jgi:tRNA modification GTPase